MKIALVTNKNYHHKFWVSQLYKNHNVSLVIHPNNSSSIFNLNLYRKKFFDYGILYFFLKILSLIFGFFSKFGLRKSIKIAEKKFFYKYLDDYERIPDHLIKNIKTINCDEAVSLIRKNNIDVICFLGGEIAKKEFIQSARFCFNFHSGISPFYNGNKTNFHAVSDFRPNFCGGTLMKMNERIDGGEILAHYFCSIEKDDFASDLFMKGILGSVMLYNSLLTNLHKEISGIKQHKSLRYLKNIDWTIINDINLSNFYRKKGMHNFVREEKIILYFNNKYNLSDLYSITLDILLKKNTN